MSFLLPRKSISNIWMPVAIQTAQYSGTELPKSLALFHGKHGLFSSLYLLLTMDEKNYPILKMVSSWKLVILAIFDVITKAHTIQENL